MSIATRQSVIDNPSGLKYPALFSPFRLGNRIVKNRIIMPGMGTNYANADGSVSDQMVAYYTKRARGGAGMIILGYTSVDWPRGLGGVNQLQLADPKVIPGFRSIVDSIEPYNTTLLVQLHHSGSRSKNLPEGELAIGPVDAPGVRGMTQDDIDYIIGRFVNAAKNAQRAGLHGVEVHAGHGYLINEFLSPLVNKRTDKYGGDVEGRSLFLRQVLRAVREACGKDFILSVRLAVRDWREGGITLEDGVEIAKLVDQEDVDLINVTAGIKDGYLSNSETQEKPDGFRIELAEAVRPNVKHPIAIVGKLRSGDMCNNIVDSNTADFVVIGRQLIADPEWPNKLWTGRDEEVRHCLNCLDGCYSALAIDSGVRCAINPYVGFESVFDEGNLPIVRRPQNVVVVGGGVSGLQAATTAAERGNNVTLVSKDASLGGQIDLAAYAPGKEILLTLPAFFERRLEALGVETVYNTEADLDWIMDRNPDAVVLATGSEPSTAPIPGIDRGIQAWDLFGKDDLIKQDARVVVIGGGSVGCDAALVMLSNGVKDITMLEMTDTFARGQEGTHRARDLDELKHGGVNMVTSCRVLEVTKEAVEYVDSEGQKVSALADVVIIATGQRPVGGSLAQDLRGRGIDVRIAGDAIKAGNIRSNISSGFRAGYGF